ncbi:MAG: hypothetical protein H7318_20040 [Oligoflexus sp.]|nr:hypothetical protein [Oligoflexus sp.]
MKRLLLAVSLSFTSLAIAQGAGAPPPVPAAVPKAPDKIIANGSEAVDITGEGFSMVPPAGWEVIRDGSGAAFLFQAPKGPQPVGVVTYQPNMRIMMMNDPRPMDNETKDEYSKIIAEKSPNISSAVSEYLVASAEPVKLQNGTPAFLYYASFKLSGTSMMQMHILVSSGTKHFLMTYTDLASVFEKQEQGLTTAYTSMQSVKLDTLPPDRWIRYQIAGGCILALFFLTIMIRVIRGHRMKKLGERIENEDGGLSTDDHDDYEVTSSISAISEVAEHDHDDDYDMPETKEAPASRKAERPAPPAPVARKAAPVPAPAPRLQAPAPVAKKASAPVAPRPAAPAPAAPIPAPAAKFEARTRKTTMSSEVAPVEVPDEVSSADAPISGTWNLYESSSPHHDDTDFENSSVSEIKTKPKTVIAPATKSKHQKAPAARVQEPELDDEGSSVARLSEILPNTGDSKKKKKGFFGWGKNKNKDEDSFDKHSDDNHEIDSDGNDDWDSSSKGKSKGKDKEAPAKAKAVPQAKTSSRTQAQPVSQVSEVAGGEWNLAKGQADHDSDDEED